MDPVAAALSDLGADPDAAAYAAALAADGDLDPADVLDFAREACPGADAAGLARVAAAVEAARAGAGEGDGAQAGPAPPRAAADASPSTLLRVLNVEERRARLEEAAGDEAGGGADSDDDDAPPPPSPSALAALALAFPSLSTAFLTHALTTAAGNVDAAAAWLADSGDAAAAERAWRAARERAAADLAERAAADAAARAALVAKFGHTVVGSGPGAPPRAWGEEAKRKGGGGKAPAVRYREGVAVSTKHGEKYITIKDKDDWDGGSRGKVLLKGKRGKGFV